MSCPAYDAGVLASWLGEGHSVISKRLVLTVGRQNVEGCGGVLEPSVYEVPCESLNVGNLGIRLNDAWKLRAVQRVGYDDTLLEKSPKLTNGAVATHVARGAQSFS